MKLEDATKYTEKCFNGEPASCTAGCPFRLDIRSFLEKASRGKWASAYKELRSAVLFPSVTAALCPGTCSENCHRKDVGDDAIDVRSIEATVIKYVKNKKANSYSIPQKSETAAVIGAGPSGLAAALSLALKKYVVTVFEKDNVWGGSLRSHERFSEFDADFTLQFSAVSADFRYGVEVTDIASIKKDYDAVYVATGSGGNDFGLLESRDRDLFTTSLPGVFLGGSICGVSHAEALAHGIKAARYMEVYIKSGAVDRSYAETQSCTRAPVFKDYKQAKRVAAASPDGYTDEEAKSEAARCLRCDCDNCMRECEMLAYFRKKPHKLAIEVYADTQIHPPFSTHTLTRQAYSCNDCGYCSANCPENVDIGSLLMLSRTERDKDGSGPKAFHDYWLREMDYFNSQSSFVFAPRGECTCSYAFFPGCGLSASNPEYVLKSYEYLSNKLNTGMISICCGAPAYWAGGTSRLEENKARIKSEWDKLGNPVLIYTCASCKKMLNKLLPEIKLVSLYEILAEDSSLQPVKPFAEAAVFDPCSARGDDKLMSAVRTLAKRAGLSLSELSEQNRCCGHGGHISDVSPSLFDDITKNRAALSDSPYIDYCVNCGEVFTSKGKMHAHILDMVFDLDVCSTALSTDKKRENALIVKQKLLKEVLGMNFSPEQHEWDSVHLIISPTTQQDLDNRRIAAFDIKEAIWKAEQSGDLFIDETNMVRVCCMEKPVITYWVHYKLTDSGAFEVVDAYYHRMRLHPEE